MEAAVVAQHFNSSLNQGLSEADAKSRLDVYGPNQLPETSLRSGFSIFFAQLITLPVALLTAAAGLSLITDGRLDAAIIMGVVGINAVIGYITESQSEKIIRALRMRESLDTDVIQETLSVTSSASKASSTESLKGITVKISPEVNSEIKPEIEPETNPNSKTKNDLIWIGLVGLSDPIRAGVSDFIAAFQQAGIRTVMITGDQSPTARAITQTLHINRQPEVRVMDAITLTELSSNTELAGLEQIDVFSRVSSAHKLAIVQTLQAVSTIVAMTGDGINDTPALKTANVGIAMGAGSSHGVHEVADVVIGDNNLKT